MSWLLDTNVISEMVRPRPEPAVLRWFEHHATEEHRLHLSALTMAEIHRGVLRLARTSPRFARLHAWAHGELPARFRERILAFDAAVARTWGMMTAALPKRGDGREHGFADRGDRPASRAGPRDAERARS